MTISDFGHELLVYKMDGKKEDRTPVYLKLPCTRSDLQIPGQQSMNIKVYNVSTGQLKLYQCAEQILQPALS